LLRVVLGFSYSFLCLYIKVDPERNKLVSVHKKYKGFLPPRRMKMG